MSKIGVILVAGGIGSRMQSSIPKQYLKLKDKPIALHSLDLFLSLPEVSDIVVVCHSDYHSLFDKSPRVTFAKPGERRQDSMHNGLRAMPAHCNLICIHDSARPFITATLVRRVIEEAQLHGAATAAMPLKYTIKECDPEKKVINTPDRSRYWEIQTPQVIRREILDRGLAHAIQHKITVTDDVSLAELLKLPVKVVEGSYTNIKITTPDDLAIAEQWCHEL